MMRALLRNLALAVTCVATMPWPAGEAVAAEPAAPGKASAARSEFKRLEGRWTRLDGGYVIDVRGVREDGFALVTYSNPRPINVHRAEAGRKDGKLTLMVELRDVNYPGSLYTLQYEAATDRLKGIYFQAMQKQTFDVEFARAR